jgi:hypothetical protein
LRCNQSDTPWECQPYPPDPGALAIVPVSPDRGLNSVQGSFGGGCTS